MKSVINYYKYIGKVLTGREFNELFPRSSIQFIKLTNIEENHNGYRFKTGLNVDHNKFNPIGTCTRGGIYFTDINNLSRWTEYGYQEMKYCREIKIPSDSKVYIEDKKMKADKIILGDRVEISDLPFWSDEERCLEYLEISSDVLRFIKNPSKKIQLAAVKKNGHAIRYLLDKNIDVSEEVQIEAVKKNGYATKHLLEKKINLSREVQIESVKNNGRAIQYLFNYNIDVSEEVKIEAVNQNGYAIKCIKNPSEKVQLAAVSQNGYAIEYITDPSEKIQLAAVIQYGNAIKYIKNPSENVQLAAGIRKT